MTIIVFLYDDSFPTRSALLYVYNGSVLALQQKTIVITLNYRVGPLGFAYFGEDSEVKGNMGLLDQQEVKKNIQALFGSTSEEGSYFLPFLLGKDYGCGFNHSLGSSSPENQCDKISSLTIFGAWFKLGDFYKDYFQEKWGLAWTYTTGTSGSNRDKAIAIFGDFMFTCDTAHFSEIMIKNSGYETYFFEFQKRSTINPWPEWMGAMHGYELEYVFGMPFRYPGNYSKEVLESEQSYATRIMNIYSNFAQIGITRTDWKEIKLNVKKDPENDKCFVLDDSLIKEDFKPKYKEIVTKECKLLNNYTDNHQPHFTTKKNKNFSIY
uniref:Acetylcholinesterase n=1 Tax=Parastrongyloides trichosuri TaxID=131310 RepID=A0A0N5A5W5_PARTI